MTSTYQRSRFAGGAGLTLPLERATPIDRHKFDDHAWEGYRYAEADVIASSGSSHDPTVTILGSAIRRLSAASGGTASVTLALPDPLDLSRATHVDIVLWVGDAPGNLASYAVEFANSASFSPALTRTFSGSYQMNLASPPVSGARVIRATVSSVEGLDLSNITHLRVTVQAESGQDVEAGLHSIRAITRTRGMVHLCFDDALLSQYEVAFPLMRKHGLVGTLGVITGRVGTTQEVSGTSFTYMGWDAIRELEDAGWAIASHTHTHADLTGLTPEQLDADLGTAFDELWSRGFQLGARGLICPFGAWNDAVDAAASQYHSWVRSATGTQPQIWPTRHGRYEVHYSPLITDAVSVWTDMIDAAISSQGLVTLAVHGVHTASNPKTWAYSILDTNFEALLSHIADAREAGTLDVVTWYGRDAGDATLTASHGSFIASRERQPIRLNLANGGADLPIVRAAPDDGPPPKPFAPTDLPDLALWLDASDADTITEADGAVSAWADKSGGGRDFAQATGAAQPTLVESAHNGLPALRFDGVDDHLAGSAAALDLLRNVSAVTLYIVAFKDSGTGRYVLAASNNASGARFGLSASSLDAWYQVGYRRLDGDSFASYNTEPYAWADDQLVLATVTHDWQNQTGTIHVNGTLRESGTLATTAGATSDTDSSFIRIGRDFSAAYWDGDVCEVLVYRAAHGDAERQQVEAYLAAKWGIG